MSGSNVQYIDAVRVYERNMPKVRYTDTDETLACKFFVNVYTTITGKSLTETDKIIDFGCGSGANSAWFYRNGYDIHGVDILEYWGKDVHLLGEVGSILPEQLQAKMFVVNPDSNKLPFADGSITMIFSDQTLEHVFDHRAIFAEQGRVLRPGGLAIHRFPHGHGRIEPHTNVPLTPLTRSRGYLVLWALLGRRSLRQQGMNWRDALDANIKVLKTTNYVSKRQLRAAASGLGLEARFEDFLNISHRRAGRLYRAAAAWGAGPLARLVLAEIQDNRVLVLEKHASSG